MDPIEIHDLDEQSIAEGLKGRDGSSSSTSVYSTAEEDHLDFESIPEYDTDSSIVASASTAIPTTTTTTKKVSIGGSINIINNDNNKDEYSEDNKPGSSSKVQKNIINNSALLSYSTSSSNSNTTMKLTNTIQNTIRSSSQNQENESAKNTSSSTTSTTEPYYTSSSSEDSSATATVTVGAMRHDSESNSTSFQLGEISFQRQSGSSTDLLTLSDTDSCLNLAQASAMLLSEGKTITVAQLQDVFDRFKTSEHSTDYYADLIDLLGSTQSRNDFQWAIHQMGGISALLFLYARAVEICRDDEIQSKALCLVLTQLKNHSKATDVPSKLHYNLIRFILNSSERSTFGFKTFLVLINHCLTPRGNRLLDYDLLDACLLSSWRILLRNRCTEAEAPTGRRSLFECLLTIILDLIVEKNPNRDLNMALLKSKFFGDVLLSICYNAIFDVNTYHQPTPGTSSSSLNSQTPSLSSVDAIRITVLIKSILFELMTPPDAFVGVCLVKYGLFPLLPKELPPLPMREAAFFTFHNQHVNNAMEAQEINNLGNSGSSSTNMNIKVATDSGDESLPELISASAATEISNEDVPEMIGRVSNKQKVYQKETFESTQLDGFRDTFQESLTEAIMTILLNTLAIIPDGAFYSVLRPHLSPHIFIAYCSHPSLEIKKLGLKLLSAYLSRVKNPCISEFLSQKGFFLTSMYIQECPELVGLINVICHGYGPVSYPLILSLLYTNSAVNTILEWVHEDEAGVIPGLMSMGFIPSVLNMHRNGKLASGLTRGLNELLARVISFCALSPKEDPWKVLLCPALESLPQGNYLSGKIFQETAECIKTYTGKELKKNDACSRLIWLLERASVSRFGNQFDKWLLNVFMVHFLEGDEDQETELWKHWGIKNLSQKRIL